MARSKTRLEIPKFGSLWARKDGGARCVFIEINEERPRKGRAPEYSFNVYIHQYECVTQAMWWTLHAWHKNWIELAVSD